MNLVVDALHGLPIIEWFDVLFTLHPQWGAPQQKALHGIHLDPFNGEQPRFSAVLLRSGEMGAFT
jgi:hypothetical protein